MTIVEHRLPDGTIPVLLSADAPDLLCADAAALLSYAAGHPEVTPDALADMLFRTRTPRRFRALCLVESAAGLGEALRAVVDDRAHPSVLRTSTPAANGRSGYVFPGQGSQRPGMGRVFYEAVAAYRAEADRCAATFEEQFGSSPLKYLLDDHFEADDTASTVQPVLFTHMAALAATWRSFGIAPDVTVGHSQGEIAAAYVAQAMTLADAVRVVGVRAGAADEFTRGDYAMAVVAAGRDDCEDAIARCGGWAQLSVVNSAAMVGISGDRDAVTGLVDEFTARGVFARVIRVKYPAHTLLINEIGESVRATLRSRLDEQQFLDSDVPCIGATLGGPITADVPVETYWFLNLRNTVRFDRAIASAADHDVDMFIELADHPTLQLAMADNLAQRADDRDRIVLGTSTRTSQDLGEFSRNLATAAIHTADFDWDRFGVTPEHPPLPLLDFPSSPMRRSRSWLPYSPAAADQTALAPIAGAAAAANSAKGAPPRLLTEQWKRLTRRTLTPPRTIGIVDHTGDFAPLVSEIVGAAGGIGATATLIDPENRSSTAGFDTIAILVPPSRATSDGAAADAVASFFGQRRWWPGLTDSVKDCWLVTTAGETAIDADGAPDLLSAAAGAGFRSIGAEHAGVRFRHLDLPTTPAAMDVVTALHTDGETELALRGGGLYAKRAVDCEVPPADTATPDHVVIVGGTGSVGLQVCAHYARRGVRRITLVSRSGETAPVAVRLAQIRGAAQTDIVVSACDIGDAVAVAALADANTSAPADVIVHAAVVFTGNELSDITAESVDTALRAKVVGAWRILETFPRSKDCRVVLSSSIGANVGGRGLIVYAAANRMIDAMASRRRAEGLDCVAVQWGHWAVTFDPEAEHTDRLGSTGIVPMAADGAVDVGLRPLAGNAIVAAFDVERARSVLDLCGRAALLSDLSSPVTVPDTAVTGIDVPQRFLTLVAGTIGVDGADSIDTTLPLVAIGLDSLQALEIRRRVKAEFDHDLDVADLLGGASISDVLARLVPSGQ